MEVRRSSSLLSTIDDLPVRFTASQRSSPGLTVLLVDLRLHPPASCNVFVCVLSEHWH